jgi:hypothetical protein
MRALRDEERRAILALAGEFKSNAERDQLLADLDSCTIQERTPDGSVLTFSIRGYERPAGHRQGPYSGKDEFPVEGVMKDVDGAEMSVYLFADASGRVYELELDKHAVESVVKPDWSTFKVR